MAAIQWERIEHRAPQREALRLVTAPPSRRRPSPGVYRRRRLVALLLVATVLVAVSSVGVRWATASASAGAAPAAPAVLVAQPGDSYWTLARKLHVGGDLRSVVDELVAANGGGDLYPGDRIVLAH